MPLRGAVTFHPVTLARSCYHIQGSSLLAPIYHLDGEYPLKVTRSPVPVVATRYCMPCNIAVMFNALGADLVPLAPWQLLALYVPTIQRVGVK